MFNSHDIISLVTWLGVLGIPSIFSMTAWCVSNCRKYTKQIIYLMQAQKAQMRQQLLDRYEIYKERGWVSIVELTEWENQFKAYHELAGENGVLDTRRELLLKMPNEASDED